MARLNRLQRAALEDYDIELAQGDLHRFADGVHWPSEVLDEHKREERIRREYYKFVRRAFFNQAGFISKLSPRIYLHSELVRRLRRKGYRPDLMIKAFVFCSRKLKETV
ncbi:hypothetical protein [Candidatus Liberibacter americanus]|uniref:Uncharacterized protein n=1 Tax=Candidatus Liberibacter americanus str. Sao Paulo TaxID=1261131 RepID=U6B8N3_9HYPH|nr:hypothetical protein [Candidatus Liberibacter americanus]AHA28102.1 hypothetical protein lam_759 [Candidatus Liberibacter americanus str. Sao Paulo]EMS36051.1 hypothetical protein G653_03621 [Candidatus Liberibacter americanus PW_SP]